MKLVPVLLGVFLVAIGAFIVWTATAGADWNSNHNRSFQRTAPVNPGQRMINRTLGLIIGPLLILFGLVSIVLGAR